MITTTSADWQAVANCLGACHEAPNLEALFETLCQRLRQLCTADLVVLSTYSADQAVTGYRMSPVVSVDHLFPAFLHHFHEHPWSTTMGSLLSKRRIMVLSDLMPLRALLRTGLWNEVYIHLNSKHQIGFGGMMDANRFFSFGLNRLGRDYGTRERELLRFMRPHIERAIQRMVQQERSRDIGETLNRFFAQGDNAHAWIGNDGALREISPKARALLFSSGTADVQPTLAVHTEITNAVRRLRGVGGQRRRFVSFHLGTLRCVLLSLNALDGAMLLIDPSVSDDPLKTDVLTRREAEVLHWLGEGKSNGEIAVLLGISVRTVERHCGNIFAKLGVENRFGATLLARHQ
jgi:DNA-binding CsgD family transcriptional regulator